MPVIRADQLDPSKAVLLLIDVQEKLLPLIRDHAVVAAQTLKLIQGAALFELPILVTEQYPRGIGPTVGALRETFTGLEVRIFEKPTFSAWGLSAIREAMIELDRPQVIIAGIETHVCVQQTALDLASRDYDTYVCADATGSRGGRDYECALHRMRQNHVFVTTVESVLFELCRRCDAPKFKSMLEIVKATVPAS